MAARRVQVTLDQRPSTHSAFEMQVPMSPFNAMGVEEGIYPLFGGGWQPPTCEDFVTWANVGVFVKVSGTNPDPDAPEFPFPEQYAVNRHMGRQPYILSFPIKHWKYGEGYKHVIGAIRLQWEKGRSAYVFDHRGNERMAAAIWLFLQLSDVTVMPNGDRFPGKSAPEWLRDLVLPNRYVRDWWYEGVREYLNVGNVNWCPRNYGDYVLWCHMLNQTAEYEVYLLYVDSLTPPTTPRGGGRYERLELQPTPVLIAIDEPLEEVANPVLPVVSRSNAQIVEAVMVDN